ncbi:MAG: hypothetical protein B7Z37_14755 [Verrucomicrobia bacterium 12-59-8]|nr:MAG: hypothetical protein B7Z37_14755 [Verrucomicrobia bacterium 12-59-8]
MDEAKEVKAYRDGLGSGVSAATVAVAPTPTTTVPTAVKPTIDESKIPKADPRKAAEWVLSVGGSIGIKDKGEFYTLNAAAGLPKGRFELLEITLDGLKTRQPVTAEGLQVLAGLRGLKALKLPDLQLTDAELEFIGTLPDLEMLSLQHNMKLTGVFLAKCQRLQALRALHVFSSSFSDEAGPYLAGLKGLVAMEAGGTSVTDNILPYLAKLPKMTTLNIPFTKVTSGGLTALKLPLTNLGAHYLNEAPFAVHAKSLSVAFPQVTGISFGFKPITRADVEALAHFPKLVTFQSSADGDASVWEALSVVPRLTTFSFGAKGMKLTDAFIDHLLLLKNLTSIQIIEGHEISDAGLLKLKALKELKRLTLKNSQVTEAGFAAFKKARPDVAVTR